jgi:hypothetical protein
MGVPTTTLGVARALVELGRLVEAREVLARLLGRSPRADEPPAFERARETARELAAEVAKRLPRVTVVLPEVVPEDIRVSLDGIAMPRASLGVPRQVDPGTHTLVVEASGYARFGAEVTLAERKHE